MGGKNDDSDESHITDAWDIYDDNGMNMPTNHYIKGYYNSYMLELCEK